MSAINKTFAYFAFSTTIKDATTNCSKVQNMKNIQEQKFPQHRNSGYRMQNIGFFENF